MGLGWNGKKDIVGLMVILFFIPVIAMIAALFVPTMVNHSVGFGILCLSVLVAGFIYILKRKR